MISGRVIVEQEAKALTQLAHAFPESFPQAIQCLRGIQGKIICSGVGKSGHVARKIAGTFASTGTHSFFVHPTEALHGDLGALSAQDALLIFSNSGETPELLRFVHHSSARIRIVITSQQKSSLSFCCDVTLLLPTLPEACPLGAAPTTSSIMMMSLGDALALTLSSLKDFKKEQYHRLHPAGALGHQWLSVEKVMQTPAPILAEDASYHDILAAMIYHRAGCVGLVDRKGTLLRILTHEDTPSLLRGGLMAIPEDNLPHTISSSTRMFEALAFMKKNQLIHLFVKNAQGDIQGILRQDDGLRIRPYGY